MPLRTNAVLRFDSYRVMDNALELTFLALDPGAGEESYRLISLTDAELAGVSTQVQLRNLVIAKLQRKERAANIASKLDQFIGQTVTV